MAPGNFLYISDFCLVITDIDRKCLAQLGEENDEI